MVVEIETKEDMSKKALNILQNLRDIAFNKIVVKDKEHTDKERYCDKY